MPGSPCSCACCCRAETVRSSASPSISVATAVPFTAIWPNAARRFRKSSTTNVPRSSLRLIDERSRPLAEIAEMIGFSAQSAMARWFRGRFGCSITEWRNDPPAADGCRTLVKAISAAMNSAALFDVEESDQTCREHDHVPCRFGQRTRQAKVPPVDHDPVSVAPIPARRAMSTDVGGATEACRDVAAKFPASRPLLLDRCR